MAVEKAKSLGYDVSQMAVYSQVEPDLSYQTSEWLKVSFKYPGAEKKKDDLEIFLSYDNDMEIHIEGVFKDVDPVKDAETIKRQLAVNMTHAIIDTFKGSEKQKT